MPVSALDSAIAMLAFTIQSNRQFSMWCFPHMLKELLCSHHPSLNLPFLQSLWNNRPLPPSNLSRDCRIPSTMKWFGVWMRKGRGSDLEASTRQHRHPCRLLWPTQNKDPMRMAGFRRHQMERESVTCGTESPLPLVLAEKSAWRGVLEW